MIRKKCSKCGFEGYPPYFKWKNQLTGKCAYCGPNAKIAKTNLRERHKRTKIFFYSLFAVLAGIAGILKAVFIFVDLVTASFK